VSAGTVLLNADLLKKIFRREGHVLKDFEDSPVHNNKSTVAKGTWERAIKGEKVRRNSWLEIARYLRITPPDLLLEEMGATFEMIVASRSSPQADRSTSGIVVKRGALTIVIGDDFSDYTFEKQQRVWQKVYDLLGEVGRGPETTGSVLVNLILDDDQVQQAAAQFLDGQFSSINAADIIFEGKGGLDITPAVSYSTSRFTNLRSFAARLLRFRHVAESDIDEVTANTLESVFLRLTASEKPVSSLLAMCRHYIRRNANELVKFRTRPIGRSLLLSTHELDQIVDAHAQPPIQPLLQAEFMQIVADVLAYPHPPVSMVVLRRRLEGATYSEIANDLGVTESSVRVRFLRALRLLQYYLADYME
jgi:RNA polymerase sigma factor (sigma-70 family)